MRQCFTYNFEKLIKLADDFQKRGKEFQTNLLGISANYLRESVLAGVGADQISRIPENEAGFIEKFSSVFTPAKVSRIIPIFDDAYYHIERNANPKILFLDLSLSIAQIARYKKA